METLPLRQKSTHLSDMTPTTIRGCVILLNGYPGVGKLSIARALKQKIKNEDTRLVDNHLTIDLALAVHPQRGLEYKEFHHHLRCTTFGNLGSIEDREVVMIMTDCLGADAENLAVFDMYVDIAKIRMVPFFLFTLSCEREQHMRRVQSPDRTVGKAMKICDMELLERQMVEHGILSPPAPSPGSAIFHMELDTSDLSTDESAARIVEMISERLDAREAERSANHS